MAKVFHFNYQGVMFHLYNQMDGHLCRNPNLGLTTKARGCKVVGQKEDPGVTSHAPKSVKSVRA
jgi:hypothetical protein